MQLTKSQKNAVSKLFNKYLNRREYKLTSFKAPTGSGKTFMASELISRIFAEEFINGKKTIIVFATISNAELPKQLAKKLEKYKKFHEFNNYKIEYIYSPSVANSKKIEDIKEFNLEENKVFVFGTSSFGKKTLFYQNKTLEKFIQDAENNDYQIIFIRDEAHIGKKENISKDVLKNFDEKLKSVSSFIMEMTATPKDYRNFVELTSDEMSEDGVYLLKTKLELPKNLDSESDNEELIDDAIKIFKKTKKEYENIKDHIIYPAMLIQIGNDSDEEKDFQKNKDFKEGLELLERKLKSANLKYLKYLDSSPQVFGANLPANLEYASKLDSHIDVIIFKVGPATGWDIPRANMLLQLRNVSSENLNIQTLGRIMRNPIPNLEKNSITDKYYLYSNYQKPTRESATYSLVDSFRDKELFMGRIDPNSRKIVENNKEYENSVINYINSEKFLNMVKDIHPDKIIYNSINYGTTVVNNKISNYVSLKIYNIKRSIELEKQFKVSLFYEYLKKISNKTGKNIEKVIYVFYNLSFNDLREMMNASYKWISDEEPYIVQRKAKLLSNYNIWIDNNNQKKIDTSYFKNYGYFLMCENNIKGKIQYLDSNPELMFFEEFKRKVDLQIKEKIKFFAKMPTLGSGVYFEYFSKKDASIKKSFMDFAIEYKDKIIMVEVKSKDADYDSDKTKELLDAYKIYMKKYSKNNLNLALYTYDKENTSQGLHLMIEGKWRDNISFEDAFKEMFK
ncbi:MAG: DEAD/DEAH box helicase [Metamycoplasmataceae bacterium]